MAKADEDQEIKSWLQEHDVQEVEVLVGDFAGISRGKKLPVEKFVKCLTTNDLRLPDSVFGMTVDCDFISNKYINDMEEDVYLKPDLSTGGLLPWCERNTAFFLCDVMQKDGEPLTTPPRQILKTVLGLYEAKGWKPIVAPEFEFTLLDLEKGDNGELVPVPPRGISGLQTHDKGVMSVDGVDEFGQMFSDVRDYCTGMGLPVDALVQEAGVGQFEFNVSHGEPLRMADVAVHFKRAMKWAASIHGHHASFLAKPYANDYGNAMHIHQSVVDAKTGKNIFADDDGADTDLFRSHIAGLQKYASAATPFFAPYDNSYLRLGANLSSPGNTQWGIENRSVGLRVPMGGAPARRIENRIAGSDTNPYLVIASSLLCGYLGMVEGLTPTEPVTGSAYKMEGNLLPRHIHGALDALDTCKPFREILGDAFIATYVDVKRAEISHRSQTLSPWDVKYLLTNV